MNASEKRKGGALAFMTHEVPAPHGALNGPHRAASGGDRQGWPHHGPPPGEQPWPPPAQLERNAIALGPDRWVIMTSCSCGYIDMAYNWALYLQDLGISHFLVFTEDAESTKFFRTLLGEHQVVPCLDTEGKQPDALKAAKYDSPEFSARVVNRPYWMESILQQGYGVLWSDSDQVWLRSVLPLLTTPGVDVFLSVDSNPGYFGNNWNFCTGFMAVRPTNASIYLMECWGQLIPPGGGLNQEPFNHALGQLARHLARSVIDMKLIQPGWLYFDSRFARYRSKALVVHDNWITGHDAKRDRFIEYQLWKVPKAWTIPAGC